MTQSVFSLSGMKETDRISAATISDCISPQYQYALENPMTIEYIQYSNNDAQTELRCKKSNLSEWNISSG